MKYLAGILFFIVLWLSVIPQGVEQCQASMAEPVSCCADDHCTAPVSEQSSSQKPVRKSTNDCCPGGICSPFQACAGCSVIREIPFQLPAPAVALYRTEKVRFGLIGSLSTFIGDFFQPPEMLV